MSKSLLLLLFFFVTEKRMVEFVEGDLAGFLRHLPLLDAPDDPQASYFFAEDDSNNDQA